MSRAWKPVASPEFDRLWREQNGDEVPPPQAWQHPRGLTALVGREPHPDGTVRWHISLRYGDPGQNGRVPTWEELVEAAHELRPGIVFVVAVPPRSWWINVHPDVLHLHELRDKGLEEAWRLQRRGDRPT